MILNTYISLNGFRKRHYYHNFLHYDNNVDVIKYPQYGKYCVMCVFPSIISTASRSSNNYKADFNNQNSN